MQRRDAGGCCGSRLAAVASGGTGLETLRCMWFWILGSLCVMWTLFELGRLYDAGPRILARDERGRPIVVEEVVLQRDAPRRRG